MNFLMMTVANDNFFYTKFFEMNKWDEESARKAIPHLLEYAGLLDDSDMYTENEYNIYFHGVGIDYLDTWTWVNAD
jgi:hypothetical protein